MNAFAQNFWMYATAATICFTAGLYCMAVSRNLIRILVGMELLTKAVTLMVVLAGAVTGRTALAQALVITLIVVEVVAISVGAGIVVTAFRKHGSVDAHALMDLNRRGALHFHQLRVEEATLEDVFLQVVRSASQTAAAPVKG